MIRLVCTNEYKKARYLLAESRCCSFIGEFGVAARGSTVSLQEQTLDPGSRSQNPIVPVPVVSVRRNRHRAPAVQGIEGLVDVVGAEDPGSGLRRDDSDGFLDRASVVLAIWNQRLTRKPVARVVMNSR